MNGFSNLSARRICDATALRFPPGEYGLYCRPVKRARICLALWWAGSGLAAAQLAPSAPSRFFDVNRSELPAAVQQVPVEHLSSGALMLLDRGGNLVQAPRSPLFHAIEAPAAVALDPRVGPNTRLGDDPAPLPPGKTAQAEPHIARS